MLIELGKALEARRKEREQSLAAVAGPANISATYLQKLERGRVTTPSPRVLRRLAGVLALPYLQLMELAGYLDETDVHEVQRRKPRPRPHPLADPSLSHEQWHAVGAFIQALKASERVPDGR